MPAARASPPRCGSSRPRPPPAIALALVAIRLAARPARGSLTYGFKRVEILLAQANGLTLLFLVVFFGYEGSVDCSIRRRSRAVWSSAPRWSASSSIWLFVLADLSRGCATRHDLHVWEVTSGFPALSAHVLVVPGADCHQRREQLAALLRADYDITHATLQVDHASPLLFPAESLVGGRDRSGAAGGSDRPAG